MARDTIDSTESVADIVRRVTDPAITDRIKRLRRAVSEAYDERELAKVACGRGVRDGAAWLEEAQRDYSRATAAQAKAEAAVVATVEAAKPAIARRVAELAGEVTELAAALRALAAATANLGKKQDGGLNQAWPAADASARGLAALASWMGAKR